MAVRTHASYSLPFTLTERPFVTSRGKQIFYFLTYKIHIRVFPFCLFNPQFLSIHPIFLFFSLSVVSCFLSPCNLKHLHSS
uniref:Uncharacterized protein n=1 Tax=Octopus bimaculoides TaxID=37653 RepID=A0A0L8HXT8_OCTBM